MRGRDATAEIERTIDVADAVASDDLVALRYLWARDRIARLEDDLSVEANTAIEQKIGWSECSPSMSHLAPPPMALRSAQRFPTISPYWVMPP